MKPPVDRLMLGQTRDEAAELRAQLAAANSLLKRVQRWRPPADQDPSTYDRYQCETLWLTMDIEAYEHRYLAAQPATAPSRTEAESEITRLRDQAQRDFALAEEWKARFEQAESDLIVAKDRLMVVERERNEARAAADKVCISLGGQLAVAQGELAKLQDRVIKALHWANKWESDELHEDSADWYMSHLVENLRGK